MGFRYSPFSKTEGTKEKAGVLVWGSGLLVSLLRRYHGPSLLSLQVILGAHPIDGYGDSPGPIGHPTSASWVLTAS